MPNNRSPATARYLESSSPRTYEILRRIPMRLFQNLQKIIIFRQLGNTTLECGPEEQRHPPRLIFNRAPLFGP